MAPPGSLDSFGLARRPRRSISNGIMTGRATIALLTPPPETNLALPFTMRKSAALPRPGASYRLRVRDEQMRPLALRRYESKTPLLRKWVIHCSHFISALCLREREMCACVIIHQRLGSSVIPLLYFFVMGIQQMLFFCFFFPPFFFPFKTAQ